METEQRCICDSGFGMNLSCTLHMPLGSNTATGGPVDDMKLRVYAWLGYWRDRMPHDAVAALQDILGPVHV